MAIWERDRIGFPRRPATRPTDLRKQNRETFLGEMMIVRQCLRNPLTAHRQHRPAIDQAVANERWCESLRATRAIRGKGQDSAAGCANLGCPPSRGLSLPFVRVVTGISSVHRKSRQEIQGAPKLIQRIMVWCEKRQECNQVVRPRHGHAQLFQQRLEILLSDLLAVKATGVMRRLAAACELANGDEVALGFSHPVARASLHRGLGHWSQSRCGTTRARPGATVGCGVCAQ